MKKLLLLPLLFVLVLAHGQPIPTNRSPVSVIPVDANAWFKALKIPVYQDTAHAFAAMGIDSIGYIFKELYTSNVWIRDSNLVAGGHKWTLFGNGPGIAQVYNKFGTNIINGDSIAVDTNALVNPLKRLGFLVTETDPIALAKTVTINSTAQRGLIVSGSAGQTLGTNPAWTIAPDTMNVLLTKAVAGNTYIPLSWSTNETITGNSNTGVFNNAFLKLIYGTGHGNLLIQGPSLTYTDTVAGYAFKAGLSTSATEYYVGNASKTFGHGLNIFGDSVGLFTDGATPIYFKSNGTAAFGAGITFTAPTLGDNSASGITSAWANSTYMPLGGTYHLVIVAKGGPGDTTLVTAHDSTIQVAAIRDSGILVHKVNPDGSYTFYVPSISGGTTQNLSFTSSSTADTVHISAGGTSAIIPAYTHSTAGVVTGAEGARLDSLIYLTLGYGHHTARASYTKDTVEWKGLIIEDTTHKLNITLRGDTTHVLDFDIDASGLAGTGTVDSVTLTGSGAPLFSLTMSGVNTVNPAFNLSVSTACSYCMLWNNTAGTAVPTYGKPILNGPAFANQGTVNTVYHGNASGNGSFGSVSMVTDVTGLIQAAQFPALTGAITTTAGSLATTLGSGVVGAGNMAASAINLSSSVVTNVLGAGNGGTGVNNGSNIITLAGNLTTAGAFGLTFTTSATTNATLPTGTVTLLANNGSGAGLSGIPLSIVGTPNEVIVSNPTGTVTLSTPQAIGTGSSPTFTGLTLSGLGAGVWTDDIVTFGSGSSLRYMTLAGMLINQSPSAFPTLNQSTTGNAATATTATSASSLSAASTLPNGTTATTQAASDNSTKVATTAYVDRVATGGTTYSADGTTLSLISTTFSINTGYTGQTSITKVGTISTGTWTATAIAPTYGGMITGGATGAILVKNSATSYDASWVTALPSGTTATTQTGSDNTTKLATDAFVQTAVSALAPLASPTFTGTPSGPTATGGTNTTQLATTAFVQAAIPSLTGYALLSSPAFGGTPTAPTATSGTNTTQLATTAFVQTALGSYAALASPTFTGTPAAPTATNGTNTTQLATTAFVQSALSSYAALASPTFTGTPGAPTASPGTNTTQLATTAFADAAATAAVNALPNAFTSWQTVTSSGTTAITKSFVACAPSSSQTQTLTLPTSPVDGQTEDIYVGNGIGTAAVTLTISTSGSSYGICYQGSNTLTSIGGSAYNRGSHFHLVFSNFTQQWYATSQTY